MDNNADLTHAIIKPGETKLSDLADLLVSFRLMKENGEKTVADANQGILATEQLIVEKLQEEDLDGFTHDGKRFGPVVTSHPAIDKEKEPQFIEWLQEHNEEGIYKYTCHNQTLKSWWNLNKDKYAEEITEKGLLKVFEQIRISVRKVA